MDATYRGLGRKEEILRRLMGEMQDSYSKRIDAGEAEMDVYKDMRENILLKFVRYPRISDILELELKEFYEASIWASTASEKEKEELVNDIKKAWKGLRKKIN